MADLSPSEWVLSIGTGVTALGVAISKLRPMWAADSKTAAVAAADTGIIERLEKEATRLSDQNCKLATSINDFQGQMSELQLQLLVFQTENNKLSRENNSLREENMSLREEIMELRTEVQKMNKTMMDLQTARNEKCAGCENA